MKKVLKDATGISENVMATAKGTALDVRIMTPCKEENLLLKVN